MEDRLPPKGREVTAPRPVKREVAGQRGGLRMTTDGARQLMKEYSNLLTPEQLLDLRKQVMEGCMDDFIQALTRIVIDYTALSY